MANAYLVSAATVLVIALALYGAYVAGLFEETEKSIAFYFMKAKAKAEEAKLESLGKVEGVDFAKGTAYYTLVLQCAGINNMI